MMEGEDEDSTDNRAFGKKPVWGRMSVVFAGPFFNFILAFIFAFILMSCVGYDKPVLSGVMEGYAAEEAGLQAGDEIIRMNHFSKSCRTLFVIFQWMPVSVCFSLVSL